MKLPRLMAPTLLCLALFTTPRLAAQAEPGMHFMVGGQVGADVTSQNVRKLIGLRAGVAVTPRIRLMVTGTTELQEPGSASFGTAAVEWAPTGSLLRPYIGGGGAVGRLTPEGGSADTQTGWFLTGGIEVPGPTLSPFLDLRLLGLSDTLVQLTAGVNLALW